MEKAVSLAMVNSLSVFPKSNSKATEWSAKPPPFPSYPVSAGGGRGLDKPTWRIT